MPIRVVDKQFGSKLREMGPRIVGPIAIVVALAVIAVVVLSHYGCANIMTPAGHEGYIRSKPIVGAAEYVGSQRGPTSTGWVWRQEVTNIDMRPRTFSEAMRILTAERLELSFRVHARIRLRKGSVKNLVEKYGGEKWYAANVQQQLRSVVRSKVQELKAFQVKNKMADIASSVLSDMKGRYGKSPIEFLSVDIGDIQYPKIVVEAVVRKFVTNEDNERKDIELKIAQRQIEIGMAEARGVADAQRVIRTTLNPMFVQYEALKAVEELAGSKNTTFVVMPYSGKGQSPLLLNVSQ